MKQRAPDRRTVIKGACAAAAAVGTGSFAAASASAQQSKPISLPPWRWGNSSTAPDAMLMFRGNGAHTFYGTGPVPETQPVVKWRFRTAVINNVVRGTPVTWAGTGWTGTAVAFAGYVFVGSVGGYVYAFDAATGALKWQLKGRGMFKSSLCAWNNRLYIGNTDDLLRCIDAETGAVLWTFNTGRDLDSSPCVIDGRLYIAGESGYLRCFDPMTGKQIWRTFVDGIGPGTLPGSNGSESSPAVADGEVYTSTYDGKLFSVEAASGRVRWVASTGDDTDSSQVIHNDLVYACAQEKAPYLYAFAREDGREVWRFDGRVAAYYATPAAVGDRVWVGGDDGSIHCVDARSGARIWRFMTRGGIWSSPCVVDGKLIVGSRDHHLYCLDATTGQEVWKLQLDGRIISSPCILGGVIYIGTATGTFYSIGAA